jgi:hypothetical protein
MHTKDQEQDSFQKSKQRRPVGQSSGWVFCVVQKSVLDRVGKGRVRQQIPDKHAVHGMARFIVEVVQLTLGNAAREKRCQETQQQQERQEGSA